MSANRIHKNSIFSIVIHFQSSCCYCYHSVITNSFDFCHVCSYVTFILWFNMRHNYASVVGSACLKLLNIHKMLPVNIPFAITRLCLGKMPCGVKYVREMNRKKVKAIGRTLSC